MSFYAIFNSASSKNFEAVQYLNFDIGSNINDDKATTAFSPYTVHSTEKSFTTKTNFNLRENSPTGIPWIKIVAQDDADAINEWILKYKSTENPTNDPNAYWSSTESINPTGTGTDLLVYYKASRTFSIVAIGPTVFVEWTFPP